MRRAGTRARLPAGLWAERAVYGTGGLRRKAAGGRSFRFMATHAEGTRSDQAVTRLAPSPTGALHLGNARTFLVNWALARRRGWRVLLRIEDLDTPRVKTGAIDATVDILAWLGLDWDGPILTQSHDLEPYRDAMRRLCAAGLIYSCPMTRREIEAAAGAPNEGERETRFPPELRPRTRPRTFEDEGTSWRLVVEPGEVAIDDRFHGAVRLDPSRTVGDFPVWTKRGTPAYQLAVVVDDQRQGVTEVVRGDDLLDSAGRQTLVRRSLGLERGPEWTHLPLVRGEDGRRLAKRHGDTRLTTYRENGVAAERVIGLLAYWSGVGGGVWPPEPMSAAAFREAFELSMLPRRDVVYHEEAERWLCS